MNITELQLEAYLQAFKDSVKRYAEMQVPEYAPYLLRYQLQQRGIRGFVSTTWGVGYEYVETIGSGIETIRSSDRIESFFFAWPNRRLGKRAAGFEISGPTVITFEKIVFTGGGYPFLFMTESVFVRLIEVRYKPTERYCALGEVCSNRRADHWTIDKAQNRAMKEVFQAILDVKQSTECGLRDYLLRYKEKTVLLLGDFSPSGRKRLEKIEAELKALGYVPILADRLPENKGFPYDLRQKVVAIASVVRFIVVDDSSKSGHVLEIDRMASGNWITVILRRRNSDRSFMTVGYSNTSKCMQEFDYDDDDLPDVASSALSWAEKTRTELQRAQDSLFPWRLDGLDYLLPKDEFPWAKRS